LALPWIRLAVCTTGEFLSDLHIVTNIKAFWRPHPPQVKPFVFSALDVLDQAESFYERTGLYQSVNGTQFIVNSAGELVAVGDLRLMERVDAYVMWLISPEFHTELGSQVRMSLAAANQRISDSLNGLGPVLQRAADAISSEFATAKFDLATASSNLARPLARAGHELYDWATLDGCRAVLLAWARDLLLQFPEHLQYESISLTLQADDTRRGYCVRELTRGNDSYELTIDNPHYRSRRDAGAPQVNVPIETFLQFVRPTSAPAERQWLPGGAQMFTW
jgi:hypothetical protein